MGKGFLRWPCWSRKVGVALPAEAAQAQSRKVSLFLFCLLAGHQLDNIWLQPRAHEEGKGNITKGNKQGVGSPAEGSLDSRWSRSSNFVLWQQGAWEVSDGLQSPLLRTHVFPSLF